MLLLKLHIANKHLLEGQRYERHFNAQHDRGQLLPPQQRPNAPTGHQQLPLGLTTPGVNPLVCGLDNTHTHTQNSNNTLFNSRIISNPHLIIQEAHDCNTAQLWRMFEDDINEEHQQMEEFVPKQHPPTSEHGWHMPGMDTYRQASTSSNGLVSDHVDDDLVALL